MKFKKTTALSFLFLSSALSILVSCQKEIGQIPPPNPPGGGKDSSLLIKRITLFEGANDTLRESYFYDTVNRKIILTWTHHFEPQPYDTVTVSGLNNAKAELSYNTSGLLTRVDYTYSPEYTPLESDFDIIEVSYDNDNILKQVTQRYMGGRVINVPFTRKPISGGGYTLEWTEEDFDSGNSIQRKAIFAADGRNLESAFTYAMEDVNTAGEVVWTDYTKTDSLVYDGTGSVQKILTHEFKSDGMQNDTYVSYEFSGRLTKGEQLYNQRKVILNGVHNMPFNFLDEVIRNGVGILSTHLDYEYLSFSKTPFTSVIFRRGPGDMETFTPATAFDSKNRLVNFTNFFVDIDILTYELQIEYYK